MIMGSLSSFWQGTASRRRVKTMGRLVATFIVIASCLFGKVDSFCGESSFMGRQYRIVAFSRASSCPSKRTTPSSSSTRLNMMFDQLTNAISNVAKAFEGTERITEDSIKDSLREVRRALLDADVNVQVADSLIEGVKKRSIGTEVIAGVSASQQFIKVMYDELYELMGGLPESKNETVGMAPPASRLARRASFQDTAAKNVDPTVVLLAGLQGAGKTTTAGRLALYLKEREIDYDQVAPIVASPKYQQLNDTAKIMLQQQMPRTNRSVMLVAADVYRPAAIQQLQILGSKVGVDVFTIEGSLDAVDIVQQAVKKAKEDGIDTVIVDTAGRQVIDDDLMDELKRIQKSVKPDETLLVVDAMTGQEAATVTAAFDKAVGLTGAILAKADGDSRGGAAVSIRGVSGKPIKFVGIGEQPTDLEPFFPDRMASRILGMGDIVSLVERASAQATQKEAMDLQEKLTSNNFDFNDYLKQMKVLSGMGSVQGIAQMMPGLGGRMGVDKSRLRQAEKNLAKAKMLIERMTPEERVNPDLFIKAKDSTERLKRISEEAGLEEKDGLEFIDEYQRMTTFMAKAMRNPENAEKMATGDYQGMMENMGNRAQRRASKKNKKKGRRGGRGFG